MAALLDSLSHNPVLLDMEALYQRIYSTPERRRKADFFLAGVIVAMSVISLMQAAYAHSVCGVGA